ncbi:hypothetical protein ACFOJ6_18910 [Gordonia humi]|uniref:hypothetical protein n=1 Tax=Gordonia humi TaxID=686429 RepID=UPI0036162C4E
MFYVDDDPIASRRSAPQHGRIHLPDSLTSQQLSDRTWIGDEAGDERADAIWRAAEHWYSGARSPRSRCASVIAVG